MPDATTMFLVRHGETVWHAENRYAGAESDVDLTDRGHDQADALARWAAGAGLDHLVVSPVRRARETAAPVEAVTGLVAHVAHDLREVGFGEAEGRSAAELEHLDPEALARFRDDPAAHPFPGAEPPADAAARGAACLHRIAAERPGRRVLVVAHNTLLRLALCDLLGLRVGDYRRTFPRLENAALCEVRIDPTTRSTALVRLNAPPQPAPDVPTPEAPARTTTLEETP
ncbi:histidine phosphatase family protein [Nocardioides marmoraquaticus]